MFLPGRVTDHPGLDAGRGVRGVGVSPAPGLQLLGRKKTWFRPWFRPYRSGLMSFASDQRGERLIDAYLRVRVGEP